MCCVILVFEKCVCYHQVVQCKQLQGPNSFLVPIIKAVGTYCFIQFIIMVSDPNVGVYILANVPDV